MCVAVCVAVRVAVHSNAEDCCMSECAWVCHFKCVHIEYGIIHGIREYSNMIIATCTYPWSRNGIWDYVHCVSHNF